MIAARRFRSFFVSFRSLSFPFPPPATLCFVTLDDFLCTARLSAELFPWSSRDWVTLVIVSLVLLSWTTKNTWCILPNESVLMHRVEPRTFWIFVYIEIIGRDEGLIAIAMVVCRRFSMFACRWPIIKSCDHQFHFSYSLILDSADSSYRLCRGR